MIIVWQVVSEIKCFNALQILKCLFNCRDSQVFVPMFSEHAFFVGLNLCLKSYEQVLSL